MTRYFFHVCNSTGYLRDEEGEELPGLDAARGSAVNTIRSIISEESRTGQVDLRGRIEVRDEAGQLVITVPFSEAIEVRTGPPVSSGSVPGVEP